MQYALLIYGSEAELAGATPEAQKQVMDEYWAYEAWRAEKGWKQAGEALQDTSQATTVRMRDGATVTTDGPFAETKEQLGGFYLVECEHLDQAMEAAAACPGSKYGSIEVRPVVDFSQYQPEGSS
jgi:hypothetical protein